MSDVPNAGVRLSIRWKVVAVLVALAVLPAAALAVVLTQNYRDAVEVLEQQHQEAVLAEAATAIIQRIRGVEDDADAVAQALALSATEPEGEGDGLNAVRALLATRANLNAARFEVPKAKVSTIIREQGASGSVPESTEQLRRHADDRGVAFQVLDTTTALVVVPVPSVRQGGARGYVTVTTSLAPISEEVRKIALRRFENVSLVVADGEHRAVAAVGIEGVAPGSDVKALAVWNRLPDGTPWSAEVGVVGSYDVEGTTYVGAVRTIAELGWAIGSYRTEAVAYASLTRLRRLALGIGGFSLLVAAAVGVGFASALTRPVLQLSDQAKLVGDRRFKELKLPVKRGDEIGVLARSMGSMVENLAASEAEVKRQAELRGDLSRFLSRDLVDSIVKGEHSLELGGRRGEVSVLFADVVAFTPLAESRSAEEIVTLLNELFTMLSEIVFRRGGSVDKFIGDCIMAVWGAAVEQPDHAERALAAAEDMLRFLETSNEDWRERFGVEIRLGIGVNSGEAIVGNVGSDKRMEYTVIGDVVNVAARLEAIARPNQILLGERTKDLAGEGFLLEDLGAHELTGRKEATRVWALRLDA